MEEGISALNVKLKRVFLHWLLNGREVISALNVKWKTGYFCTKCLMEEGTYTLAIKQKTVFLR